jgi:L-asparagine transporter-like permease
VGTELTAVAIYMRFWLPGSPGWIWMLGFGAALVAVNAASVRWFGRIEYAFSAIKVAAIIAFIAIGSVVLARAPAGSPMGFANYVGNGGFLPHGLSGVWTAVIVAIFSYFSIEMVAVAAGEAANPRAAILGAFRATLLRLAIFYLATLALMLAIVPWTAAGVGSSPFVTVMAAIGIPGGAGVLNAVVLIAALSAMNSQLYTASRMLLSLARAGQAPRRLMQLTARGVPLSAMLASALGIAPATALYAWRPDGAFGVMLGISAFGGMFTWMMIFVTHLAFRWKGESVRPEFRMWLYPWTSFLGAGLMAVILLTTPFTQPFRTTLLYGVPFLAVLSLAYLGLRKRSRN